MRERVLQAHARVAAVRRAKDPLRGRWRVLQRVRGNARGPCDVERANAIELELGWVLCQAYKCQSYNSSSTSHN